MLWIGVGSMWRLVGELEKKRPWVRDWLRRRVTHGASTQLFTELRFEDPAEYRTSVRMSPDIIKLVPQIFSFFINFEKFKSCHHSIWVPSWEKITHTQLINKQNKMHAQLETRKNSFSLGARLASPDCCRVSSLPDTFTRGRLKGRSSEIVVGEAITNRSLLLG